MTERAELYAVDEGSLKGKMIKHIVMASAVLILFIDAPTLSSEATTPPSFQNQPSAYVLGPSDVITIQALDVDEISNKPIWIDTSGFINLPLVGRLKVAGLTLQQLEAELNAGLKSFVKDPHTVVMVSDFRSQPVSILGMVNTPGVHQVQGRKTLLEVLSMAGGVRPEAGSVARITRHLDYGAVPVPGATTDASSKFSVADVHLKALIEGRSPEENIQIRPHDVISVPKAELVYVIGEVKKAGGFVLGDRKKTTVVEVLAMAEGMLPEANRKKAELLRLGPGQDERSRISLNLDKIFSGKAKDIAVQPEDILVISPSIAKGIKRRIGETALSAITSLAIYGGLY